MKGHRKAVFQAVLLCGLGLAGCATGSRNDSPVGEVSISGSTWDYYQQYLRDMGPAGRGAFAVSRDGRSAYYFYCPGVGCVSGADYKHGALKGCESKGQDCVIFAYGSDILVKYRILD